MNDDDIKNQIHGNIVLPTNTVYRDGNNNHCVAAPKALKTASLKSTRSRTSTKNKKSYKSRSRASSSANTRYEREKEKQRQRERDRDRHEKARKKIISKSKSPSRAALNALKSSSSSNNNNNHHHYKSTLSGTDSDNLILYNHRKSIKLSAVNINEEKLSLISREKLLRIERDEFRREKQKFYYTKKKTRS